MSKDTIIEFQKPGEFTDELTQVLRAGAQRLIAEAIAGELSEFLARFEGREDAEVKWSPKVGQEYKL